MASKAQKAQVIITANASVAKRVMEELQKSAEAAKMRMIELAAAGEQNSKAYKKAEAEFQAFNSAMRENVKDSVRVDQVMKQLSKTANVDLKRALAAATRELNKMSEGSPKRQKLIDDINRLKAQINGNSGLTMSFKQAQTQLKNLDNVSMEKLKQGLAAIKSQLDNPNIGNKWRRSLEQMQQQYQAAMAVRTAPTGAMPVAKMNAQQLGAERTALMSAIAATSGVKGYEGKAAGYEQRLKAVNEQLKLLTDNEKKADQAAKQLQATQEAAQTVRAVYRGQAVELEKLQAAYKTLQARQQQFAGTNDAKARAAAQQMALLKNRIDKVTAAMQAEIKIDKQFLKTATNAQLQNALTQLQQKLQSLNSTQSATAQKLKADMKAVETQIKRNTGAIQQQGNTFGTAIKNIAAYVGVFGAFNMIKSKVMDVYKSNLKLSDSLADIRKVSGLTAQEIDKLYTNITRIDTRNTIETLNKLAYAGAKLGVQEHGGVEALTGFVRAAEQVQMALGEDLGEEALPALAKLTEVMGLMDKYGVEQSMQKAASAIFMLSTTSTATGKNIVEFSKRLMGLANVSRVASDELLAIGSAADAMGLMPEVAATAFNKLFTSIQKGHNMIEKSLGLAQGSINENFAKGQTIKSIVDIFEAMNKKGNMNALDGIFKDLGSDGARLVAVMTTMADRVDILKKHLETSTKAFKDGTAVVNEYMIQNETANALMERAQNMWAKAFTNPEGVDMVKQLAEQWYEVSKAMTQSEGSMAAFHNSIEGITTTVITLIKTLPFLIKMLTWFGIFGGIRMMYNSFVALAASIRAATTATATLQVVMNSNWVLAGIAAVVGGISLYIDHMNAAAEAAERAQKRQAELDMQLAKSKEAIDTVAVPLESYRRALNESNYSLEKRNQLMRDLLKGEYQDYLDYLGIEIDGAIDLAKAYDMVVKVLKQKKAYEEREQYRDEVNQNNKIDRMRAGMQFGQTAKSLGAGAEVDAEWLRRRHNLPVDDVMASVIKSAGGSVKSMDFGRGVSGNAYYDKSGKLIEAKVIDRLRKNIREYSASRNLENRLDKEVDDLYKEEVGDFDMEKFQDSLFKAQLKRKGQLDNLKPDKEAIKAAKKAKAEHKQAIRKDLQDAKQESDAIIAKIEEWYRLQETVVTGFAADGKWTQQQAEMVNRELEAAKNEALANARLAISGRDTQTWEQTKESLRVMMFDTGEWSQELFQQMMDVSMASIRQNLSRIDKEGGQYGITTSSLKDALDKNAAGNRRKVQELRNKTAKEVEKALLQYDYFEQAARAYEDRLTQLGLLTETAEQAADRIRKASGSLKAGNKTEEQMTADRSAARRQAGQQFIKNPGKSYAVDYTDTASLNSWLQDFSGAKGTIGASGMEFQFSGWAEAFKDQFNLWLKDSEKYKADIQGFYLSLVDFDTAYYDAVKQNYDKQKKQFDSRWNASGMGQAYETMQSGLDRMGREQKMTGADRGVNFAQQAGFAALGSDPEIAASQLRMQQMQDELDMFIAVNEKKKLEGAALEAFNQQVAERQRAVDEAQLAMAETVMSKINDRISKLQEWTAPIEQFGADVGDAMGKAVFESESMVEGMQNALKTLARAWGEHTIQIIKELMMQQLKQKMINKAMKKEQTTSENAMTQTTEEGEMSRENLVESIGSNMVKATAQFGQQKLATKQQQDTQETTQTAHKTIFDVLAGIAGGSAKTIESLGWWGIPLVAVISALLMGLLNTALSALSGGSNSSESKAATPKVKLKSGMLTYDKGNVQQTVGSQWRGKNGEYITDERRTVVGDDGRVYRAKEQRSLPEGVSMVTEPIATRVNGQQALVGERGPEIVIGRKTTRAIQMNRPDLLRDLALIDRGITTRKVRTFDEGNIQDLASAFTPAPADGQTQKDSQQDGQLTSDDARALTAAIGVFAQTVAAMQKNGIPAKIQKYGTGGLIDEVQSGLKFVSKYK